MTDIWFRGIQIPKSSLLVTYALLQSVLPVLTEPVPYLGIVCSVYPSTVPVPCSGTVLFPGHISPPPLRHRPRCLDLGVLKKNKNNKKKILQFVKKIKYFLSIVTLC